MICAAGVVGPRWRTDVTPLVSDGFTARTWEKSPGLAVRS